MTDRNEPSLSALIMLYALIMIILILNNTGAHRNYRYDLELTEILYTVSGSDSEPAAFFGMLKFNTSNIIPNTHCRVVAMPQYLTAEAALSNLSNYHVGNVYPVVVNMTAGECNIASPSSDDDSDWSDGVDIFECILHGYC